MKAKLICLSVTLSLTGCLTRAPTEYELDRRAGLTPPESNPKKKDSELAKFSFEKQSSGPRLPNAFEKRIEKTWLYERNVGGGTLQPTWYWTEVNSAGCNCDAPYDTARAKDASQTNKIPNSKR